MNNITDVFSELLNNTGEILSSKLIHKTEQPYLEGIFIGIKPDFANIEIKIDHLPYDFPIDYFDSAYIPRPKTKLIIYSEDSRDIENASPLRIMAIDENLQLLPLAATYQFSILKASPFDGLVLHHPQYGRIICNTSEALSQKIMNREIIEKNNLLFKIIQAGRHFLFIPLLTSNTVSERNDFEKILNLQN